MQGDRARYLAGQRERRLHDVGIGINAKGSHGRWAYSIVKRVADVGPTYPGWPRDSGW